jgi:hypothetical protein
MEKEKKPMPSQQERPDIYDNYDFPPGSAKLSQGYKDSVLPDAVKARRAAAAKTAAES